jgi:hypothetical protein
MGTTNIVTDLHHHLPYTGNTATEVQRGTMHTKITGRVTGSMVMSAWEGRTTFLVLTEGMQGTGGGGTGEGGRGEGHEVEGTFTAEVRVEAGAGGRMTTVGRRCYTAGMVAITGVREVVVDLEAGVCSFP